MIANIIKTVVVACVIYKIYRKLEEIMLNDGEYLNGMSDWDEETVNKTIEEARRCVRDKEYDLATEYLCYAHKLLGCSWDFIVSQVDSREVHELLRLRRNVKHSKSDL